MPVYDDGGSPNQRKEHNSDQSLQKKSISPSLEELGAIPFITPPQDGREKRELACPFFLNDPEKCRSTGFRTCQTGYRYIHRLKEHISRRHLIPQYECPGCSETLEGYRALTDHQNQYPQCLAGKSPPEDMRLHQRLEIEKGDPRALHIEAGARRIYRILFPHQTIIPDPYWRKPNNEITDSRLDKMNNKLDSCASPRNPKTPNVPLDSAFQDRETKLQTMLSDGLGDLFDDAYSFLPEMAIGSGENATHLSYFGGTIFNNRPDELVDPVFRADAARQRKRPRKLKAPEQTAKNQSSTHLLEKGVLSTAVFGTRKEYLSTLFRAEDTFQKHSSADQIMEFINTYSSFPSNQWQLSEKGSTIAADSGYASAQHHNLNLNQDQKIKLERIGEKHQPTSTSDSGDDANTIYSIATTVIPETAQKTILIVCSDIYERLGKTIMNENWKEISQTMPPLIKAFAVKLGTSPSNESTLKVMHFIHARCNEIATQLQSLYRPEVDDTLDTYRDTSDAMPLVDKMKMWQSNSRQDDWTFNDSDYFEGVREGEIEDFDLSTYGQIILNNPAYEWLITALVKELLHHWDKTQPRIMTEQIRQKILEQIPTGKISQKQTPRHDTGSFLVEWPPLRTRLKQERGKSSSGTLGLVMADSVVATCSSVDQAQLTTVKQYMDQTWPSGGMGLLNVLQKAIDTNEGDTIIDNLPDNTEIQVKIDADHVNVSVSGTAYSVAERGEQLAWLVAALLPAEPEASLHASVSLVSLTNKYSNKHLWRINTSTHIGESSSLSAFRMQQCLDDAIYPVIVRGFPTILRPEGCAGVEVSANLLLELAMTPQLVTKSGRVLLEGTKRTLQLFAQTEGVLVWHVFDSSKKNCSCQRQLPYQNDGEEVRFSNLFDLQRFRHILGDCPSASAKLVPRSNESRMSSDHNKVEVEISECFTTMSFESQNSLEEMPSSPLPSGATTESLDSDMLSISDSVEDSVNKSIDINDPLFGLIMSVAHRLVSGHRASFGTANPTKILTKLPSDENDAHEDYKRKKTSTRQHQSIFDHYHHSTDAEHGVSSTPDTSYSSQGISLDQANPEKVLKRTRQQDDSNDSDDEDSSRRPKPKRRILTIPTKQSRLLACPFWKFDASKHHNCFRKKLDTIARVKQHLDRNHTLAFYCERCFAIFPDYESHQAHLTDQTEACKREPGTKLDGISHQQRRELSRKSKLDLSEQERWFVIWKIVLPDHPPPLSPYIDSGLSEDLCQFREYSQNQGPSIVAEELQNHNLESISQDELENIIRIASSRGLQRIFDEWLLHRDSSEGSSNPLISSTLSERSYIHGTSVGEVRSQTEVSPFADSGVVLASAVQPYPLREYGTSSRSAGITRPIPLEDFASMQSGVEDANANFDGAGGHFRGMLEGFEEPPGRSLPQEIFNDGYSNQDDLLPWMNEEHDLDDIFKGPCPWDLQE